MKIFFNPILRSLVLWLGLFVLCFLVWAWIDSNLHATAWNHCRDSRLRHSIYSSRSLVVFSRETSADDGLSFGMSKKSHGDFFRGPAPEGIGRWNRAPGKETVMKSYAIGFDEDGPSTQITRIVLPWWFIVACYLPAWLALSFWRARRIARLRIGLGKSAAASSHEAKLRP